MGLLDLLFGSGAKPSKRSSAVSLDREMVLNKWQEIGELMELGGPSRMRSAIIEADKLLDYALKAKGFGGENLGERLKSAKDRMDYSAYDCAWKGHKLRNKLVHEIEADVLGWEVKQGLKDFERALRDLKVL
jgi:hypothetical protein